MEKSNLDLEQAGNENSEVQEKGGFVNKLTSMMAASAILFSGADKVQADDSVVREKAIAAQNDQVKMDELRKKLESEATGIQESIDKAENVIEIREIEEALASSETGIKSLVEKHGRDAVLVALKKQEQSIQETIQRAESRLDEKVTLPESSVADQIEALKVISERFRAASNKVSETFGKK